MMTIESAKEFISQGDFIPVLTALEAQGATLEDVMSYKNIEQENAAHLAAGTMFTDERRQALVEGLEAEWPALLKKVEYFLA